MRERAIVNLDEKKYISIIDRAVRDMQINMDIYDAEGRIWTLEMHYVQSLEANGLPDLTTTKLQIAILHIISRILPS